MDPDSPQPDPAPEITDLSPTPDLNADPSPVEEPVPPPETEPVSEDPSQSAPEDLSPSTAPIELAPAPVVEQAVSIEEPVAPPIPETPISAIPAATQAPVTQPKQQVESVPQTLPSSPIISGQVTPELASLFQSWLTAYQKSLRALGTIGLRRKHQKHLDQVVELAGKHGSITRQELRLAMRMSAAQIDKYTHELVATGRLRHVGAHDHGRYERM